VSNHRSSIFLHRIGTAVPQTSYTQEFALQFLSDLQGADERVRRFLRRIYQGTAIEKRHTVIDDYGKDPSEFTFFPPHPSLKPEPTTSQRNDRFVREADRLSLAAAGDLFAGLPGVDPGGITHLITVSCTGFSAPGFDLHLVKTLPLRPTVHRFHLGFMGCYAAFPALKLAQAICRAEPDARVLIVNVELCTLHFQQRLDPDTIVANALFSDGASAALVSAHPEDSGGGRLLLHRFAACCLAGSEEAMAWTIGDTGFQMRLSAYVPRLIQENIRPAMDDLFRQAGIRREQIKLWAIHPGGKAILEKIEQALGISHERLQASYGILREFGNMSSATIMFVLRRILESAETGRIFAAAFGPGLTIECGYLEKDR
jgi:predicted naringenin-chalcone synthase